MVKMYSSCSLSLSWVPWGFRVVWLAQRPLCLWVWVVLSCWLLMHPLCREVLCFITPGLGHSQHLSSALPWLRGQRSFLIILRNSRSPRQLFKAMEARSLLLKCRGVWHQPGWTRCCSNVLSSALLLALSSWLKVWVLSAAWAHP